MQTKSWKQLLAGALHEPWAREIDAYESQLALKREERLDDKVFAETRLRRGAYGQRYDNGQRHDGTQSQALGFDASRTKGPNTLWDAPGMQRIKIPSGKLTTEQLELLCDLAEEYSDQILHVTTRQDIQLHYVHIDDTPDLMRRLAAVGITTREACGNSVRNVTACHLAGVCCDEQFDVTPYADALAFFLLGHPATQDLGRKFKVAFSGCDENACGLTGFHDIGCVAKTRSNNGQLERGFAVYVGGGLGPVPHAAELLDPFVPVSELLPLALAVCRVFARFGERENRSRARMKFVVMKQGIEQFKHWVAEERARLKPDPRWLNPLGEFARPAEAPKHHGAELSAPPSPVSKHFLPNVQAQRQAGFHTLTIKLPLGDFTPTQGRGIAELARRYTGETLRTTVEQNLVLRWVRSSDLAAIEGELAALGLDEGGAGGISDITSCPGTDTCKLGISSSRGLARELRQRLKVLHSVPGQDELPAEVSKLHIKCSGCFNSCGQHHVADLGFLGVSRNVNGRRVPHFQLVLGGSWENNAREFGLAIGAVPAKHVPEVVTLLTDAFTQERLPDESFRDWTHRAGRRRVKELIGSLTEVPPFEAAPELYRDWGDPRVFTIGDIGVGECAGEVISPSQFAFAESERLIFDAQLRLDDGDAAGAQQRALAAMTAAARAVCLPLDPSLGEDVGDVGAFFDARLGRNGSFDAASPGGRFSRHFAKARETAGAPVTLARARQGVEEAQLFIDAAHAYDSKHDRADGAASAQVARAEPML
ncbi:MAG TPA: nitrite/sulfite reductase [Polyangiaceae bacterium]